MSSYYIITFLSHFYQADFAISKVIYLFDFVALICPILEKDIFIENFDIVLLCLIK